MVPEPDTYRKQCKSASFVSGINSPVYLSLRHAFLASEGTCRTWFLRTTSTTPQANHPPTSITYPIQPNPTQPTMAPSITLLLLALDGALELALSTPCLGWIASGAAGPYPLANPLPFGPPSSQPHPNQHTSCSPPSASPPRQAVSLSLSPLAVSSPSSCDLRGLRGNNGPRPRPGCG